MTIFDNLKQEIGKLLDEKCEKLKIRVRAQCLVNEDHIKNNFKDYEKMLSNLLCTQELNDVRQIIKPYLERFNKLSKLYTEQIEKLDFAKDYHIAVDEVLKESKAFQRGLVDNLRQSMESFCQFDNNLIFFRKIKNASFEKDVFPRLHTNVISKLLSYDNNTKLITCSNDRNIIIRNKHNNQSIRTLSALLEILLY